MTITSDIHIDQRRENCESVAYLRVYLCMKRYLKAIWTQRSGTCCIVRLEKSLIRQGSHLPRKDWCQVDGNCATLLRDLTPPPPPPKEFEKTLCANNVSVQICVPHLHPSILTLRLEPFCRLAASVPSSAQQTWVVMRMCADSWAGQDALFHDWLNWGVHRIICSSTLGPHD